MADTFRACFDTDSGRAGGVELKYQLGVDPGEVSGRVHLTQAINPPLDETIDIHGTWSENGNGVEVEVSSTEPGQVGGFQGKLSLPDGWSGNGTTSYQYGTLNGDDPIESVDC